MGTIHPSHVFSTRDKKGIPFDQWRCIYCRADQESGVALKQCPKVSADLRLPKRTKFEIKRQHPSHLMGPVDFQGKYFPAYTCLYCGVTDSISDVIQPCPKNTKSSSW